MISSWPRKLADWTAISARARQLLGMNQRNLWYVYPNNPRRHFPLADDKLKTKEVLGAAGIPMPKTFGVYRHFYQLRSLAEDLALLEDFVIKPSQGRGGGGILVITGRDGEGWRGFKEARFHLGMLRQHLGDILFGVYSFGLQDAAILEERIIQHPRMDHLSPLGLADVRVILHQDRPIAAMSRIPTRRSAGRANLHQGGLGVGIELATGRTVHAILDRKPQSHHPDTGVPLLGVDMPFWEDVLDISRRAAQALPLKYLGVDIALTPAGPLLIEVNVRPGIEIQNANRTGLRQLLEASRG